MRYPGPHRHEHSLRALFGTAAFLFFIFGLMAFARTERAGTVAAKTVVAPRVFAPSPSPSPIAVTYVRLFDGVTHQALAGEAIALVTTPSCALTGPCPTTSPLVLTADANGQITVAQALLRQQPKLYAAGYKLDTYFAFLAPDQPNQLTLYKPIDTGGSGAKINYDLNLDTIPIGLSPAE